MLHQMNLPGVPPHGLREVAVNFRLWGDDTITWFLTLRVGTAPDDLTDEVVQCSRQYEGHEIGQAVHAASLTWSHICRRAGEPFPVDLFDLLDESYMLYGHL